LTFFKSRFFSNPDLVALVRVVGRAGGAFPGGLSSAG